MSLGWEVTDREGQQSLPSCSAAGQSVTPSRSAAPGVREQLADGSLGRRRPGGGRGESVDRSAGGRGCPSPSAFCTRTLAKRGASFKNSNRHPQHERASCVVRQGGCRGALRRCPQGRHPPPGAGSPKAGEQACAPIASPPGLTPWIHPTSSCKARKGAGCGDALAPEALLLEPERLRREGADGSERGRSVARLRGTGGPQPAARLPPASPCERPPQPLPRPPRTSPSALRGVSPSGLPEPPLRMFIRKVGSPLTLRLTRGATDGDRRQPWWPAVPLTPRFPEVLRRSCAEAVTTARPASL